MMRQLWPFLFYDLALNKIMMVDRAKKGTEVSFTENETPNFLDAIKMLKNADALLERRKKQLRVQQMKAHKGSWI